MYTADTLSRAPIPSTESYNLHEEADLLIEINIEALQSVFSCHGIPETVISDNGPQYSSNEFDTFAKKYNFNHITSSSLFPQSNGQVERAVQTVKRLMKRSDDHIWRC